MMNLNQVCRNKKLTCIYSLFLFLILQFAISPVFASTTNLSQPIHFLSLADIHFDPFIACHNKTPCPIILKLREAPAKDWPMLFTTYDKDGPQYGRDTNYQLLVSSLAEAKKIADEDHVQFVLMLGDFLGHDYRHYYMKYSHDYTLSGYRSFVYKTFEFLTNELANAFPSISVYTVVGNNDSYHGDYVSYPNGQFFENLANLWSSLIKNKSAALDMQNKFGIGGYYAVDLPAEGRLRLIVLNTNFFSYKSKGKNINKAAEQELDWLHNELQKAKDNRQKVFIAMHIPTGIDIYASLHMRLFTLISFWRPVYEKRFKAELQQFAPEISAVLAGHLHIDRFQMLTLGTNEIPSIGTPSVSPVFGNNPGFKIFTYSPTSQQLDSFVTYFYPLRAKTIWGTQYDFERIYQPYCHRCAGVNGGDALKQNGLFSLYYKYFHNTNTNTPSNTIKWSPYYWCAMHENAANENDKCVE